MDEGDEARRKRALHRADWPLRKFALGQEPEHELAALTPGERVAMVWQLTLDAWAAMGASIPDYARSNMPGKVVRRRGQTT